MGFKQMPGGDPGEFLSYQETANSDPPQKQMGRDPSPIFFPLCNSSEEVVAEGKFHN